MKTTHKNRRWTLGALGSLIGALALTAAFAAPSHAQERIVRDYDPDYGGYVDIDPELDVEIWTDNESGIYYEGDEIKIYFRANRDCWVAIYNIDTDGRVNLIYPFDEFDDPYVEGGRIYRIPDRYDDYELIVQGPAGVENIQIVASRTPFPVPNWFDGSGLVADRDRYEFMDWVNGRYFGCRSGCFRALDDVSFTVREWDSYYYRPVYYHPWPSYRHYGYVYIDYWWGSSVYIDGYYYGIAPLYLPRIALGHHIVTVYDHYGYCWEGPITVHHDRAVHLNDKIIRTNAGVNSRYRAVRKTAYRDPVKHGYPNVKVTSKVKPRGLKEDITRSTTTKRKTTVTTKSSLRGTKGATVQDDYGSKTRGFGYKRVDRSTTSSAKRSTVEKGKATRSTATEKRRLSPYKDDSRSRSVEKRSASERRSSSTLDRKRSRSESARSTRRGSGTKIETRRSGSSKSPATAKPRSSSSKKSSKAVKKSNASSSKKKSSGVKKSGAKKSSGKSSSAKKSPPPKSSSSKKSSKSGGSKKSGKKKD